MIDAALDRAFNVRAEIGSRLRSLEDQHNTNSAVALHLEERAKVRLDGDEKPVLALLSGDPLHVDEVCQGIDMSMAKLLGILMQLELKGVVRQLPGKFFVRQF